VNLEQKPQPDPDFEQRLLARLKAVVAERGATAAATEAAGAQVASPSWRRRGPRLALGGGVALAAIAVVLALNAGSDNTSKAFAVEPLDGGGVTIKVHSLEEAAGLEKALADAGIPSQVSWLPAGTACREPHYTPSKVKTALGGSIGGISGGGPGEAWTIGVMTTEQYRDQRQRYARGEISADEFHSSTGNITFDPAEFRPDQSVVLSGAPVPYDGDPEGGSIATMGVAEGPVEPCEPVPALPSGGPIGLSAGGAGSDYTPRGNEALGQTAIAAELRRVAIAAEASKTQVEVPPGAGQLLYVKTKVAQLQGWEPEGPGAGPTTKPRYFTANLLGPEGDALPALVPTLKEVWTASDGTTRERETLGRVNFLSGADQVLWEEAGSPPPFAYDSKEHDVGHDTSGRLVKEFESKAFRGRREFSYLSRLLRLPTEPEALRLSIENRRGASSAVDPSPAGSSRGGATVERLLEILSEPITSPALRAAAFNALAEIPGIGLKRDVSDVAGRRGDAISWVRDRGFGRRYIFDPHTSEILAEAEMIIGPPSTDEYGAPAGTPFRETAYRQSGIVDSTRERPGEAKPETR
jgi:hypothetical protein